MYLCYFEKYWNCGNKTKQNKMTSGSNLSHTVTLFRFKVLKDLQFLLDFDMISSLKMHLKSPMQFI